MPHAPIPTLTPGSRNGRGGPGGQKAQTFTPVFKIAAIYRCASHADKLKIRAWATDLLSTKLRDQEDTKARIREIVLSYSPSTEVMTIADALKRQGFYNPRTAVRDIARTVTSIRNGGKQLVS